MFLLDMFVKHVIRPRWIVNDEGEMGIRILGVNCYYYKWADPLIETEEKAKWQYARKREFGETVKSERTM